MKTLIINGERADVTAEAGLTQLLRELGYPLERQRIIVAVNGTLVPYECWTGQDLNAGDQVDIMGAITGG